MTALGRILCSSFVMVLAFRPGVLGSNPSPCVSAMDLFICLFVMDFVRKTQHLSVACRLNALNLDKSKIHAVTDFHNILLKNIDH